MPFSEPTQAPNERDQVEAQNGVEGLFEELFGNLDEDLALPADGAEENKRTELYAIAASIFA